MYVLISLALLVTTTSCTDLSVNPTFRKLETECRKENHTCLPMCIGEKTGVITKTGTIDPAKVDSELPKMMPVAKMSAEHVTEILTCIKQAKKITTCEDAHHLMDKCLKHLDSPYDIETDLDYYTNKPGCLKEAGIEDLEFGQNAVENFRCFYKCMWGKVNFLSQDGTVNHKVLEKKLDESKLLGRKDVIDFMECVKKIDRIETCNDMGRAFECQK